MSDEYAEIKVKLGPMVIARAGEYWVEIDPDDATLYLRGPDKLCYPLRWQWQPDDVVKIDSEGSATVTRKLR